MEVLVVAHGKRNKLNRCFKRKFVSRTKKMATNFQSLPLVQMYLFQVMKCAFGFVRKRYFDICLATIYVTVSTVDNVLQIVTIIGSECFKYKEYRFHSVRICEIKTTVYQYSQ